MADSLPDATARKRLRRVPEQLRKRSAQSCDLCRKRRCRCVPGPRGTPCATCEKYNVECSYALPRKPRFYGSIDDLSDRQKCLEAIVRGAFPGEPVETVADLRRLGQRMGYPMPEPSTPPAPSNDVSDRFRQDHESRARRPHPHPPLQTPSPRISGPDVVHGRSLLDGMDEDSSPDDGETLELIRDPAGRQHYIGPSGSLQFLSQLRRLLSSSERQHQPANSTTADAAGASKFTEDDAAQALEADGRTSVDDGGPGAIDEPAGEKSAHDELSPGGSMSSSIARDFTSQPCDAAADLFAKLPPRHVADALVDAYFQGPHEDFPLFHRGTFEEEYESYWALSRQPEASRTQLRPTECGWVAALQMMIVFGSMCDGAARVAPAVDHAHLRKQGVAVARSLLPQLVSKCSLSNVQALLLLSLFLHNHNERNAAWNLVGTATRISFALGLHRRDVASSFRPIEREGRKRVFCTLYTFEQFLASSLGRPSGLNDSDVEVALPKEGILGGGGGGGGGGGADRVVALGLRLQNILGRARISQAVQSLASRKNVDTQRHEASARETMALLASWRGDLAAYQSFNIPSVADPDDSFREENGWSTTTTTTLSYDHLRSLLAWQDRTQLRAALVLHMQYRHIAIMVTRPFLLRDTAMARAAARDARHQTAGGDVVSESCAQLAELCVQNACQLAKMFLLLDEFGLADGVCGMDVFYAYSASMVLILRSVREGIREPGAPETKVQGDLRRLISALRRVVFKVAKSGTMKRFARVMAMFEDSVFHHSAAVVPRAEQIRRDTVAAPRDESGVPFGPTGIEGPQLAGRFAPVDLSTLPHVPSMTSLLDTTFPGAETWPQGDWGTFDESRELSGWIASLLQPLDTTTTAADYEDVDWVLRNAPM